MTRRLFLVLLAVLALCLAASGCNRDAKPVDQPTVLDPTTTIISPWDILEEDDATTTEIVVEQTDPIGGTATAMTAASTASTTMTKLVTTTTAKKTSTTSRTTTTTAKTTTTTAKAATASTTKSTTTTQTPGSLSIASKDAALQAFNSAVGKAVSGRAGFSKSHMITYQGWKYDPGLFNDLNIPLVGDAASYISGMLNTALNNGVRTASNQKGSASGLISNSTLAMADMRDVTYAKSGSDWTVTLFVKSGETRRQKSNANHTGTAPLAKSLLNQAINDGTVYDHMDAGRIFNLIRDRLSLIQADPLDVSESTTNTKIVAVLNAGGQLKSCAVTYDQTINIRAIKFLAGTQTFRDNTGSSSVTIKYDAFLY